MKIKWLYEPIHKFGSILSSNYKELHRMECFYRKKGGGKRGINKEKKGLFVEQDIFWGGR